VSWKLVSDAAQDDHMFATCNVGCRVKVRSRRCGVATQVECKCVLRRVDTAYALLDVLGASMVGSYGPMHRDQSGGEVCSRGKTLAKG